MKLVADRSHKLLDYVRLMRLDRPIGIWLLMWPMLWGLWFAAGGVPPIDVLVIFVLGTVLMRSAGCVINDFADRHVDPHVARTAERPLASGRVSAAEALALFAGLCLIAFALAAQLGAVVIWLSVPALVLAASYPFAKRFHHMPQAHLGAAFAWGVVMAWAAVTGTIDWPMVLLLMGATVSWAIAYDTFYALVDRDDDLRVGVKSSAILFGDHALVAIAVFQALALILLALVGSCAGLGAFYAGGLLAAGLIAAYQHRLAITRGTQGCFQAFLNNHYFGMAVFVGLAVDLAL